MEKLKNEPDIVKDRQCSFCNEKTEPNKGMNNYHQYTLWFVDETFCDIALCNKCLPKMIGREGKEKVLQKLKNTSYMTWGEKKLI